MGIHPNAECSDPEGGMGPMHAQIDQTGASLRFMEVVLRVPAWDRFSERNSSSLGQFQQPILENYFWSQVFR